jgi:DNA-binding MarR family transcriptional regulator
VFESSDNRLLAFGEFLENDPKASKLKMIEIRLLACVIESPGLPVADLSIAICRTGSNTTILLNWLASLGLIEKRDGQEDRRITHSYPTPAGLDLYRELKSYFREGLGP